MLSPPVQRADIRIGSTSSESTTPSTPWPRSYRRVGACWSSRTSIVTRRGRGGRRSGGSTLRVDGMDRQRQQGGTEMKDRRIRWWAPGLGALALTVLYACEVTGVGVG